MNPTTVVSPEVRSLMEAVCDGIADEAQVRDLQSLLRTSDEICHSYIELLHLDAELQWLGRVREGGDVAVAELVAAKQSVQDSVSSAFPTFFVPSLTSSHPAGRGRI
jgi:hypothetical protein